MIGGGIITDIKCGCGECDEYIVHSWNRVKRGLPPPLYIHGHFGIINLKPFRFKKGSNKVGGGKVYRKHSK